MGVSPSDISSMCNLSLGSLSDNLDTALNTVLGPLAEPNKVTVSLDGASSQQIAAVKPPEVADVPLVGDSASEGGETDGVGDDWDMVSVDDSDWDVISEGGPEF